jgi:hypothetical protein
MRGIVLLMLLLSAPSPGFAQTGGFDRAAFDAYVESLGGLDAPRAYGYRGTVYDVPSGRVVARVEGYQIARAFRDAARPDEAVLVRRAFLIYRAAESEAVLAYYPDIREKTIGRPPLSVVRLTLAGDRVTTRAVTGLGGKPTSISLPEQLSAAREGAAFVFRRVLAPPDPQQQPVEITETVRRAEGAPPERIRTTMTKVANNQSFLPPGGRHLLHLVWRPAARFEDLPAGVQKLIEAEAPMMKSLPETLAAALAEAGLDRLPEN